MRNFYITLLRQRMSEYLGSSQNVGSASDVSSTTSISPGPDYTEEKTMYATGRHKERFDRSKALGEKLA